MGEDAASIARHLIMQVLLIVNADRRQISLLPLLLKPSITITKVLHENDLFKLNKEFSFLKYGSLVRNKDKMSIRLCAAITEETEDVSGRTRVFHFILKRARISYKALINIPPSRKNDNPHVLYILTKKNAKV